MKELLTILSWILLCTGGYFVLTNHIRTREKVLETLSRREQRARWHTCAVRASGAKVLFLIALMCFYISTSM